MLKDVYKRQGYGFSDISDVDRDIDTILFETRESLNKAGIKNSSLSSSVYKK